MGKVYIMGDVHGNPKSNHDFRNYQDQITPEDVVIICGNFGIPFGINDPDRDSGWSEEEHEQANWLNNLGCIVLALRGNHDDTDAISQMPSHYYVNNSVSGCGRLLKFDNVTYHNIYVINDPAIWKIFDKTFLFLPGAESHDIQAGVLNPADDSFQEDLQKYTYMPNLRYRILHWNYWNDEDLDIKKTKQLITNLTNNHKKVDYIISHDAPAWELKKISSDFINVFMDGYSMNETKIYLSWLYNYLNFEHWYTGHYHVDKQWTKSCSTLYKKVEVLEF